MIPHLYIFSISRETLNIYYLICGITLPSSCLGLLLSIDTLTYPFGYVSIRPPEGVIEPLLQVLVAGHR